VLGLPSDAYLSQASEGMLTAFEQRVERLHAAGYDVVQTDALADIEAINARHRELTAAEAALEHARLHTDYGDRYATATSDILRDGRESTVGRVVAARNGRRALRRSLAATSEERGIDIWLSPAATDTPPAGIETTGDPVMNLPWTHAGVPTVSVPAGTLDGLPVGVQVAGQFGDDERLLTWSEQLQSVVGSA
jgi:Asp-tRNA(Asn)/Glu-tRNA(Gln) amidotransferase A subunit family amidase